VLDSHTLHKELRVRGRRAEEGIEIHQDLRGQLRGTRRMLDEQPGIIRENEWIGGFGFGTNSTGTASRDSESLPRSALFIIDDEQDVLPPTSELLASAKALHCSV